MKVLVIGPSDTRSCGGMAEVIRGIRESASLNQEFQIDIFPSYIDGSLAVRLLYSAFGIKIMTCSTSTPQKKAAPSERTFIYEK